MLHPEIKHLPDLKIAKIGMFLIILVIPAFSLLAIGLSFANYIVGWIFFAPIGIISMVTRLIFSGIQKCRGKSLDADTSYLLKSVANKERTEFFTDGVFATVATLIVLELTENLPKFNPTSEKSLNEFFISEEISFGAYITSYVILGSIWFIHHSLFQFLTKTGRVMTLLNAIALLLVGFIPFISDLLVRFSSQEMQAANATLRLASATIFLIGLCHIGMYVAATWDRAKYWSSTTIQKEGFLVAKMCVFPFISFITYWVTFSPQDFKRELMFDLMVWSVPVIFLAMRISIAMVRKYSIVRSNSEADNLNRV
jgi:uncharacterized membrane protein